MEKEVVLVVQRSQVEWGGKHANILQALGTYNVRKVPQSALNSCGKVKCITYTWDKNNLNGNNF